MIGGDNSSWEFSAVDVAVRHVGAALWQYDLVNVVTSAFEQLYTAYLERFRPEVLSAIRGAPVCVGHIDCYNSPITVLSYRSQHWLRSCFLMLPVPSCNCSDRLYRAIARVVQRQRRGSVRARRSALRDIPPLFARLVARKGHRPGRDVAPHSGRGRRRPRDVRAEGSDDSQRAPSGHSASRRRMPVD